MKCLTLPCAADLAACAEAGMGVAEKTAVLPPPMINAAAKQIGVITRNLHIMCSITDSLFYDWPETWPAVYAAMRFDAGAGWASGPGLAGHRLFKRNRLRRFAASVARTRVAFECMKTVRIFPIDFLDLIAARIPTASFGPSINYRRFTIPVFMNSNVVKQTPNKIDGDQAKTPSEFPRYWHPIARRPFKPRNVTGGGESGLCAVSSQHAI
jgi:hypothetical protein